jgi:hypothetical protein
MLLPKCVCDTPTRVPAAAVRVVAVPVLAKALVDVHRIVCPLSMMPQKEYPVWAWLSE